MSRGPNLAAYGHLKLIRGAIVLSWEKYGVHLLDAIFGITSARPVSVCMMRSGRIHSPAFDSMTALKFRSMLWGKCAPHFSS